QNCGACGATCDTAHSTGATCSGGNCAYTGCANGWADCNRAAPDNDGCETDLGATGQKQCAGGQCVPLASCCTTGDCTMPPGPTTCFGPSSCPVAGGQCNYPQNPGSVICN